MRRVRRWLWSALFAAARAEAHTLRLRGTERLLRLLYPPDRRQTDFIDRVIPYGDSLIQADTRSFLEWSHYVYGGYEMAAVSLLRTVIHPGCVVFDVGANIGTFTLPFARRVGPSGAVHAFEPHPTIRRRLTENVALNNLRNVSIIGHALGHEEATTTLYGSVGANLARSSLRKLDRSSDEFECYVETLDAYVSRSNLSRLDLLKIDTEGADYKILLGSRQSLSVFKPIIYAEVYRDAMRYFGDNPEDMFEYLASVGYIIFVHHTKRDRRSTLSRLSECELRRFGDFQNWLAVHPDSVRQANSPLAASNDGRP